MNYGVFRRALTMDGAPNAGRGGLFTEPASDQACGSTVSSVVVGRYGHLHVEDANAGRVHRLPCRVQAQTPRRYLREPKRRVWPSTSAAARSPFFAAGLGVAFAVRQVATGDESSPMMTAPAR